MWGMISSLKRSQQTGAKIIINRKLGVCEIRRRLGGYPWCGAGEDRDNKDVIYRMMG